VTKVVLVVGLCHSSFEEAITFETIDCSIVANQHGFRKFHQQKDYSSIIMAVLYMEEQIECEDDTLSGGRTTEWSVVTPSLILRTPTRLVQILRRFDLQEATDRKEIRGTEIEGIKKFATFPGVPSEIRMQIYSTVGKNCVAYYKWNPV
jgi:hypothetical protein